MDFKNAVYLAGFVLSHAYGMYKKCTKYINLDFYLQYE